MDVITYPCPKLNRVSKRNPREIITAERDCTGLSCCRAPVYHGNLIDIPLNIYAAQIQYHFGDHIYLSNNAEKPPKLFEMASISPKLLSLIFYKYIRKYMQPLNIE